MKSKDRRGTDLNNYKGIYANDDSGQKFTDELTGAHFRFEDMCRRLSHLKDQLRKTRVESETSHEPQPCRNPAPQIKHGDDHDTVLGMFRELAKDIAVPRQEVHDADLRKLPAQSMEGRNTRTRKYQSYDNCSAKPIQKENRAGAAQPKRKRAVRSRCDHASRMESRTLDIDTNFAEPRGEEETLNGLEYTLGNKENRGKSQILERMYVRAV